MGFLTIENECISELLIQKSRFISFLFPCANVLAFNERVKNIKKEYYDATHIVPAYRILSENNQVKEHFSDDREPAKTAGWPLLYILQQKSLIQIGVIVVRYFGGIKLGTSGLQKAYSESLLNALTKANIIDYQKEFLLRISINAEKEYLWHEFIKNNNLLSKINIKKSSYINKDNKLELVLELKTSESVLSFLKENIGNKNLDIKIEL